MSTGAIELDRDPALTLTKRFTTADPASDLIDEIKAFNRLEYPDTTPKIEVWMDDDWMYVVQTQALDEDHLLKLKMWFG